MLLLPRLLLILLLLPIAIQAQDIYVPDELKDWQEWVLKDREFHACPFFFDRAPRQGADFVCAWPGQLDLVVDGDSGRFTQLWTVYATEQWLGLPGNINYWPHRVAANGRGIEVVVRDGVPSVYLGPGTYRITGTFEWDERPGVLPVPRQIGLVALTVNGQVVQRPERSDGGVFLGERRRACPVEP